MSTNKSQSICILGAHRSGTSTVTRGFNLLGAYLGKDNDLMKPLPENPEGFWERYDVYYLQDRMLSALKREWASTASLPENWLRLDGIRPLRDELVELVRKNFSGQPLWAWKDPRTCLLLPLWKDVLAELGIGLKIVFAVRSPLDVARSLERRNGFSIDKGLGVWFNNTLTALHGIEGLEAVFLSYDSFLGDWEAELKRCATGLGIAWPADETSLQAEMASFVRRDLCHSHSDLENLRAVAAPDAVIRLYSLLLDILSGKVAPDDAVQMAGAMYQEFCSYSRLFDYDMAALADCRKLLEEKTLSAEMLPEFSELKKELDSRTEWAWKLDAEVKLLRERLSVLENSLSWLVTKPLRYITRLSLKNSSGQTLKK